jgi:2-oxo-3-hexenedioate decarboxylase
MDIQDIAKEAFAVLGTGRQVAPFSGRHPDFGPEDAYRVTAAVRALRETRGERAVGRKIGFTNRTIWAEYNVHAPMWGYVYDRTVHDLLEGGMNVSLSDLAEPRIEPEVVFGLAAAPVPGMDKPAPLGCIDWVAHGFEIVQSIFPNWTFLAPDTIAAYGLHGALWIGPRHSIAPRPDEWLRELSAFEIDLFRKGPWRTTAVRRMFWMARYSRCSISSSCSPQTRSIRLSLRAKLSQRERSRAPFRSRPARNGRPN